MTVRLSIARPSAQYRRVTLNNPPINLFDPEMLEELVSLTDELERDEQVRVVVFDNALPDYFMAHLGVARADEFGVTPGPTGLPPWPGVALRLERAAFVTAGVLRGRARGVGANSCWQRTGGSIDARQTVRS